MLLHAFVPSSRSNGPGNRAVVLVQGCRLACEECWNIPSHPFVGNHVSAHTVADMVLNAVAEPLDGITFSGGEPMHQAEDLRRVMRALRRRSPGLSFGMFTGYTERELAQGQFFTLAGTTVTQRARLWTEIRALLDFAVMGRYNRAQPCDQPLRTSRNQRLRLFSDCYTERDFGPPLVEVTIDETGTGVITGFPTRGLPV
jgi:anaerobic ribonucleoside-triphosphate reductase activating protein